VQLLVLGVSGEMPVLLQVERLIFHPKVSGRPYLRNVDRSLLPPKLSRFTNFRSCDLNTAPLNEESLELCSEYSKFQFAMTAIATFNHSYIEYSLKIKIPCKKPWRPIGLRSVEDPTSSRKSADRLRLDCLSCASAALYPQIDVPVLNSVKI
jgi:hypothetical protein